MDQEHNALVLMLLVIWSSLVLPAPIPDNCASDFEPASNLVNVLHHEATDLKNKYTRIHRINNVDVPDEVPASTITGSSVLEKLQDIYTKNKLFQLHILQVKKYQKELLPDPKPLLGDLIRLKNTLSSHFHVIKKTLGCLDPSALPSTSPSLPDLGHYGDYSKKVYGWGVLVRLIEWLDEVKVVLA